MVWGLRLLGASPLIKTYILKLCSCYVTAPISPWIGMLISLYFHSSILNLMLTINTWIMLLPNSPSLCTSSPELLRYDRKRLLRDRQEETYSTELAIMPDLTSQCRNILSPEADSGWWLAQNNSCSESLIKFFAGICVPVVVVTHLIKQFTVNNRKCLSLCTSSPLMWLDRKRVFQ